MSNYQLDDDNLYLRCLNDGEIRIRKITNPGQVLATIELYKIVNTMNDGLKVCDEIISGPRLRELEAELKKYKIYVNRQGYCYVVVDYVGGGSEIHRLNDFFNWSKYGVVPKITMIWNRCEMHSNAVVIDYEKKEKEFADMKLQLMKKDTTLHYLNDELELKAHDLTEKDKYIAKKDEELREIAKRVETYEQELNEERRIKLKNIEELKDCKLQLERRERELSVIDYEQKEKEFADMKLQLMEKDKIIHHLNDTLEVKARDVIEKDECIAKKDEELREIAKCIERNENEKETHIRLKNQELKDCELQLEKREKELSILINLWERRLGAFSGSSNSYNDGFIDKEKELQLYKACLEENERELRKISSQLSAEQKRVDDLKFAMNSVASYVNHIVNASIDKEANYNFRAPSMSGGRECDSLWRDLEDGSTGATVDI